MPKSCSFKMQNLNKMKPEEYFHQYAFKVTSQHVIRQQGKIHAYSHHLAESSSRNFYAEEDNYRNKECVHAEQVKLLDKRLRILEDETEILKVAFLEDVEEKRKLVNEIQNEFQAAFRYSKRLRHGLPQILCDESNPAVVIRKLRASDAIECVSELTDR